MKDLIEYIAKSLVHQPDAVEVAESGNHHRRVVTLKVAADDMGRVIGKEGRIAQAMRVLLKVSATRQQAGQPVLVIGPASGEGQETVVPEDDTTEIPEEPDDHR